MIALKLSPKICRQISIGQRLGIETTQIACSWPSSTGTAAASNIAEACLLSVCSLVRVATIIYAERRRTDGVTDGRTPSSMLLLPPLLLLLLKLLLLYLFVVSGMDDQSFAGHYVSRSLPCPPSSQ